MNIRRLSFADLPHLMSLTESAGWNQTDADWLHILRCSGTGAWGIEVDDRVVATAVLVPYDRYCFVSMVLTVPEFRGRGFARKLVTQVMDEGGGRPLYLDASEQGAPLYRSLGFVNERPIERWIRPPAQGIPTEAGDVREGTPDLARDAEIFGADRSNVLSPWTPFVCGTAYAFERPGRIATYFGPCIAERAEDARALGAHVVGRCEANPIAWDLFPEHREASALATDLGFEAKRPLMRMVFGAAPRPLDARIYGIAGFEFG